MPAARSERFFPRDSAPHQSKSTARSFPSPSAAARATRVAPDLPLHAEKARSILEEQFDDERVFESEVPFSDLAREPGPLREGKARRFRVDHKERGSLRRVFRDDGLASRNRSHDTPAKPHAHNSKPKSKLKAANRALQVEVFIPSTVSVGNLARILGVKLGPLHFYMTTFRLFIALMFR